MYSGMFSGRAPPDATELANEKPKAAVAVDAQKFIEAFKANAFFTSGCGAVYTANILNALDDSELVKNYPVKGVFNPAGTKLVVGQRLLPGKLTRAVDANQIRIQQDVKMNGAFRILVFAGDFQKSAPTLKAFDAYLNTPTSFFNAHRPAAGVASSVVDSKGSASRYIELEKTNLELNPFFTFQTVFTNSHTEWDIESIPLSLRRYRDQIYSDDLFDVRVKEAGTYPPLHTKYGVDVNRGSIIVVRPDGYTGAVVALSEEGWTALGVYFAGFLTGVKQ